MVEFNTDAATVDVETLVVSVVVEAEEALPLSFGRMQLSLSYRMSFLLWSDGDESLHTTY